MNAAVGRYEGLKFTHIQYGSDHSDGGAVVPHPDLGVHDAGGVVAYARHGRKGAGTGELIKQLHGISKRWTPGCVRQGEKDAAGRRAQRFHLIFTQPVAHHSEIPCTSSIGTVLTPKVS